MARVNLIENDILINPRSRANDRYIWFQSEEAGEGGWFGGVSASWAPSSKIFSGPLLQKSFQIVGFLGSSPAHWPPFRTNWMKGGACHAQLGVSVVRRRVWAGGCEEAKAGRQDVDLQASCGCLTGHACMPQNSAALVLMAAVSTHMDRELEEEQIDALFVWIGAQERGGWGRWWVEGPLSMNGMSLLKILTLLPSRSFL
eukprot:1155998-Pelagomonas_calceolata.AAC.9